MPFHLPTDNPGEMHVSRAARQAKDISTGYGNAPLDCQSAAEVALARWDWAAAISAAEAALDRAVPDDHGTLRASLLGVLAEALDRTRQWVRARDTARAGLAIDIHHPRLWRALGHALAALGSLQEAVDAFDQARAHTPVDDLPARLEILGERYRYAQQLLSSTKLDLNAELMRQTPQDTSLLTARLNLLLDLGRDAEALDIARVLTARPPTILAQGIAWWLTRARLASWVDAASAEARVAAQEALRLAPGDSAIQRSCDAIVAPPAAEDHILQVLMEQGFERRPLARGEALFPPLCAVPEGPCALGSDPAYDHDAYTDELPQRSTVLPAFEIGRYPVTVAEYTRFVAAGGYSPLSWRMQLRDPLLPVRYVSWFDAMGYCAWLSRVTGERWRLPTEAEWEKAARWDAAQQHARIYPWGDSFDGQRCNVQSSGIGAPTPIGSHAGDESPSGARDMAGNVWEWTSSLYVPQALDGGVGAANGYVPPVDRVLRGGSWSHPARLARTACRGHRVPLGAMFDIGFRVVRAPTDR